MGVETPLLHGAWEESGWFFKHSCLYALVKNVGAAPRCTAVDRPAPKSVLWVERGQESKHFGVAPVGAPRCQLAAN